MVIGAHILDLLSIAILIIGIGQLAIHSLNLIMLLLIGIWFMIAFLSYQGCFRKCLRKVEIVFLVSYLLLFILLLCMSTPIVDSFKVLFLFFVEIFPLFLILFYIEIKKERFLVTSISIVLSIVQVSALIFYHIHPGAARVIAATNYMFYGEGLLIGGGYPLTVLSCVWGLVVTLLLKEKKKVRYFFSLALSILVIIYTESAIFFISFVVCFILIQLLWKRNGKIQITFVRIIRISLLVIVIFASYIFIRSNYYMMVSKLAKWNNTISIRLISFLEYLFNGRVYGNDSIELRTKVYEMSLRVLCKYPIIGAGVFNGFQYSSAAEMGLGNHSELIDLIAMQGVFCIPLIIVFVQYARSIVQSNINAIFVFLFILLASLFNPVFSFSFSIGYFCLSKVLEKNSLIDS